MNTVRHIYFQNIEIAVSSSDVCSYTCGGSKWVSYDIWLAVKNIRKITYCQTERDRAWLSYKGYNFLAVEAATQSNNIVRYKNDIGIYHKEWITLKGCLDYIDMVEKKKQENRILPTTVRIDGAIKCNIKASVSKDVKEKLEDLKSYVTTYCGYVIRDCDPALHNGNNFYVDGTECTDDVKPYLGTIYYEKMIDVKNSIDQRRKLQEEMKKEHTDKTNTVRHIYFQNIEIAVDCLGRCRYKNDGIYHASYNILAAIKIIKSLDLMPWAGPRNFITYKGYTCTIKNFRFVYQDDAGILWKEWDNINDFLDYIDMVEKEKQEKRTVNEHTTVYKKEALRKSRPSPDVFVFKTSGEGNIRMYKGRVISKARRDDTTGYYQVKCFHRKTKNAKMFTLITTEKVYPSTPELEKEYNFYLERVCYMQEQINRLIKKLNRPKRKDK